MPQRISPTLPLIATFGTEAEKHLFLRLNKLLPESDRLQVRYDETPRQMADRRLFWQAERRLRQEGKKVVARGGTLLEVLENGEERVVRERA